MTAVIAVAESELGRLLAEAIQRKATDVGGSYSLRDLERDSGVNYSYASKVINNDQAAPPSKHVIRSWSRALSPHLNLDETLMAAGYMPDNPTLRNMLRRVGEVFSKEVPTDRNSDDERRDNGGDHP